MKFFKKLDKKIFLLLIPLGIYLSFGLHHLTEFETADEHYWMYDSTEGRIHDYWRAISQKNWAATRINDKPGVTVALISGAGLFFQDNSEDRIAFKDNMLKDIVPEATLQANLIFRLPILAFNGFFIFFFYWIAKKLTDNSWIALIFSTLVLLNPILLGISQIVNPDSLLWVFANASLFSFLVYIKKEEAKYAVLSSLFLGLAFLSKYAAVLLVPFFALTIGVHFLFNFEKWKKENLLSQKVLRFVFSYFGILSGAAFVFSLLMPAVFTDPSFLYKGTIGFKKTSPLWIFGVFFFINVGLVLDALTFRSRFLSGVLLKIVRFGRFLPKAIFSVVGVLFFLTLVNYSVGGNFLDIKDLNFDAGRTYPFRRQDFIDQLFLELYPMVFSLTPIALLGMIFYWGKSFFKEVAHKKLAFFLSSFVVVFYAAVLEQQLLANIRYSVMIYPTLMMIVALGLYELFKWENISEKIRVSLWGGVVVLSFISLWLIKPFYFNYTNDFLPEKRIITGAWGYGGYEAAQYLNSLPNSKNLIIWSDYWGTCSFFKGICIQGSGIEKTAFLKNLFKKKNLEEEKKAGLASFEEEPSSDSSEAENIGGPKIPSSDDYFKIDYFVTSRRGIMNNKKAWMEIRETVEYPEWSLEIDDRPSNYVKVYKNIYD